ncbi:uncharacterized protein EMH_0087530 [Eimeria mitis]|uniref:Uncharacterized protein n=1 Tax=Eimeria mitis TaxID=44415 RepID=U6KEP0_9EIME|nr:uncharacterized protein EMH_0087530 [Eimeria mitis]CDJ36490.1 hypothetical protein EMH_0087530 [Eimeria mitis]
MVGKCLFFAIIVLICCCLGKLAALYSLSSASAFRRFGQPARPLFIKFAGCSKPPFFPQVSIVTYRQHVLKTLMQVFRLRHPNDAIGGPEVMAACAQAAALLDAYRSLRSAYLDYHMQHDPHAGMSEDSAAWMAGRFNLMLQEDQAVANDKNVRKGLKWCIDSSTAENVICGETLGQLLV